MKHVDCAGGIVIGPTNQVALIGQEKGYWSLPKGHVEAGETFLEAAKREIEEEIGIKELEIIKDLGSFTRTGTNMQSKETEWKSIHMFLCTTKQHELYPEINTNTQAKWMDADELCACIQRAEDNAFVQKHLPEITTLINQRTK